MQTKRLIVLLILAATIISYNSVYSQTTLAPGDLAVIGFKTKDNVQSGDDAVKILTLVDLTCGTKFIITDNNYRSNNTWYCNGDEFGIQVTVTAKICAGSVIYANVDDAHNSITSSSGALTYSTTGMGSNWGSNFGLNSGGDDVILLQSTSAARASAGTTITGVNFVYALKHNGAYSDKDCSTGSEPKDNTAVPSGLSTASNTAIQMASGQEQWHYKCTGATYSGTKANLLAAIANTSNWTSASGQTWGSGTCTFTVNEPSPNCVAPTHSQITYTTPTIGTTTATLNWAINCTASTPTTTSVLVLVRPFSVSATDPTNGTAYTTNTTYGTAAAKIGSSYAVYTGTGTSVNITGLAQGTKYAVDVYEKSCFNNCYNSTQELTGSFTTSGTPLPIELIYFTASSGENGNLNFQWATATEINNDHFEVEGSTDGLNFRTIETIKGNGNSGHLIRYNYSWVRNMSGQYFRLKQVDYNGQTQYSSIVHLQEEGIEEGLKLLYTYPQPAANYICLVFNKPIDGLNKVTVMNAFGQILMDEELISEDGYSIIINTSNFDKGVYIIHTQFENDNISSKLLIEK